MAFRDYSLTPASNTVLSDGTYIGPNMLRNKVRPAFQQIAADGKELSDSFDTAVEAVAGSNVSDLTLRIDMASNTGAGLTKHKSSYANTYARSLAALKAVGADDSDGVSIMHWIDPTLDDDLIAGTNTIEMHTYLRNAAAALQGAGRRQRLSFPAFDFVTGEYVSFDVDDLVIDLGAARISSDLTGAQDFFNGASFTGLTPTLALTGDRMTLRGGHLRETASTNVGWRLEVSGAGTTVEGTLLEMVNSPGGSNYQAYIRGADDFIARGMRTKGADGIFYTGVGALFEGCIFEGEDPGGDDGIALKAPNRVTEDVKLVGCTFRNLAAALSIGSEIGTAGANDPTFAFGVQGVSMIGCVVDHCNMLAYIKPGAVVGNDYRNGYVRGVTLNGNTLIDPAGAKFTRGVALTPGRGCRIDDIKGGGNHIIARASDPGGGARLIGALDIFLLDLRSDTPTSTAPSVNDVNVGIDFNDQYNGVAAGGASPGSPVQRVVAVQQQTAAWGSASGIVLDTKGNGSTEAGLYVSSGLDDAVRVRRLDLTNVNVTNTQNGAVLDSTVQLGTGYWNVVPAAGTELGGTGRLVAQTGNLFAIGGVGDFPTAENVGLDVEAGVPRLIAFRSGGVGYRALNIESATLKIVMNGTDVGTWDSTGLNLAATKVLKVNGNQVVGARGAALPADATDLATALTLLNAVKARMKTTGGHGLVAD